MTTAPRIGLLGGSFDPPHLAHRALGRVAQRELALDELRWLPAGAPWQKADRALAAPEHRLAMLRLLLEGEPRSVVDARELQRQGPSYTLDTVTELQAERPDAQWFLIIGQDQYGRFDTWRDWPALLQRVTLAVAARQGQAPAPPPALAGWPHRMRALDLPRQDISASAIRARVAAGAPVAALVGDAVAGYIDRQHLYRSPDRTMTTHAPNKDSKG